MSYILEALRKAEAERRRGSVPDLHAQALPGSASAAEPPAARSGRGLWLAGGALLAVAAAAAWVWLARQETALRPGVPAPLAAPQAMVTQPPAPPASVPVAVAVAAPDKAPGNEAQKAAEKPPEKAPAPKRKPKPSAKRDPAAVAAKAPAVQAPAASAPLPAATARTPALAELPGELRQQVPALTIGGSVYSPQAGARMVVVNGQVFQEGNALTPELKLEQIRQKSAVFSIRGTRFEVPL